MNLVQRSGAMIVAAFVGAGALVALPSTTTDADAAVRSVRIKDKQDRKRLERRIVRVAKKKVGNQYVAGATGPHTFDCSGLVVYTYKRVTGKTLPRTSYQQYGAIKHISRKRVRKGDLIFFLNRGHVGIAISKNRFVHASNPRTDVRIDSFTSGYWAHHIDGYARVIQKRR